jgi:DNA-binding NtrC family response regulator
LCNYHWPGNVRELERLVERVVALAADDVVHVCDLPPGVAGEFAVTLLPSLQRGDTLRMWACRYARLVYEQCEGNKRRAARRLGISNHTLSTYLKATAARPDLTYSASPPPEPRRVPVAADA